MVVLLIVMVLVLLFPVEVEQMCVCVKCFGVLFAGFVSLPSADIPNNTESDE